MKSLEALKILYPNKTYSPYYTRNEKRAACKVIEKDLKAFEIIKEKVGISWKHILDLWLKTKLINDTEYSVLKEVLYENEN